MLLSRTLTRSRPVRGQTDAPIGRQFRAPPITVFGAPAASARGSVDSDSEMTHSETVNQARVKSYKRMNAHNEADVNVPNKKTRSGKKVVPPRSYPGFSQPASSTMASTSGRGRGKVPEEADDEAVKIAVLCVPRAISFCEDNESRAAPSHDILMDAFQHYQRTAKDHGLWFIISVDPTQGTVLPQVHEQIVSHFDVYGLTLPPGDRLEDTEDFGTLPWQLIKMKKRKQTDSYMITREGSLHAGDVTMSALKARRACNNPGSETVGGWILINPRFGDIKGPITALGPHPAPQPAMQEEDHHCFGDRFTLLAAPPKVKQEMCETVECMGQCPTDNDTPTYSPYLAPYSPRAHSPGISPVRAHISHFPNQRERVEMARDDDNNMDFELDLGVDHVAERVLAVATRSAGAIINTINPVPPRPRSPILRTLEPRPATPKLLPMTDGEMSECMRSITSSAWFNDASPCTIAIVALTMHLAARAVINILEHAAPFPADAPFDCPEGVVVGDIIGCEPISFLDLRTSYEVGPAIGNAVKTGVYQAMTEVFQEDFRLFKMHHNAYTIELSLPGASTPRRRARLQAYGAYFAIHSLSTNRGPPKTSFALPLAMLLTPEEFIRLLLEYIGALDAQAAQKLQPWVHLAKDAAFPKTPNAGHFPHHTALLDLLLELNINAVLIDNDRSEAAHDAITKVIFCKVLFDLEPTQIWGHPDFEAFKRGYNLQVEYGKPSSRKFLSFFPPQKLLSLIACMYTPRSVDPSALVPRLRFTISGDE
ncbi:hypothetical protein FIBSPDRAFT_952918 [Athelia psychrophila]|uniref:Uncharacterized protein n=1 Tax=Athelia psychrophila TaxID=1759441 RepID=A0A166KVR7_9AGAM|nr:hypothetical protein FIBSPDRAFT_952918 [Fibularhizoctonia sp. CBS 109695]